MGPERDPEDPYLETGSNPKLSLVGRIEMTVNGRPVSLIAREDHIVVQSTSLRALFSLWSDTTMVRRTIRSGLQTARIRMMVSLGWFGSVEIFPNTPTLLRYLN